MQGETLKFFLLAYHIKGARKTEILFASLPHKGRPEDSTEWRKSIAKAIS